MITTFIGGRRQITFDDFSRTKSFKRLLSGLKALEADMRCWNRDNLVNHAYVVYARSLVEESISHPEWGGWSINVDEAVRRVKWTNDDVMSLVTNMADNHYPELVALDYDTIKAISLCIEDLVEDQRRSTCRWRLSGSRTP